MAIGANILKQLLEREGLINAETWRRLETDSKLSNIPLERLLISRGIITRQYLNELLSKYLNVPTTELNVRAISPEILNKLPEDIARRRRIVVFDYDKEKNIWKVAMEDPTDADTINFVRQRLGGEVEPYLVSPEDLRFVFRLYTRKSTEEFERLISEYMRKALQVPIGEEVDILANIPLAQLFDTILDYAATLNASDIFFMPEETTILIRFRVDGFLRDILTLDKSIYPAIVARTKVLSNLRIDEHMRPQDGRFRFNTTDIELDVRSAIIPTFYGEKVTLRLLYPGQELLSFEELGMDEKMAAALREDISKPYGMILSTGPTGSGKTTTIYTILNFLNRPEVHIVTLEDPVEYIIPRVSQTQVNPAAGITFASGLRSLLRHNPDILVIGEIRDKTTAALATHAALTGHILISTLHTDDAVTAIPRLVDLGVPPFLVAATVNTIIAQRLVRKICRYCIESYEVLLETIKLVSQELERSGKKYDIPKRLYHGAGCPRCGYTGYSGRTGIFEIFRIDEKVRELISRGNITVDALRKEMIRQGSPSMFEDGLRKVEQGITTLEEIIRTVRGV
jgi:type IV pilus assembly protein PilB